MSETKLRYVGSSLEDIARISAKMVDSDNDSVACFGRLLQTVTPNLVGWMQSELSRGTDPAAILSCANQWFSSMAVTMVVNVTDNSEAGRNILDFMSKRISEYNRLKLNEAIELGAYKDREH